MPAYKHSAFTQIQEIIPKFYFPEYQPVVDTRTGMITGYESLMRCVDKHSNKVSAAWLFQKEGVHDWIQLEIDRSVRRQALQRFARDRSAGSLHLNISPAILTQSECLSRQPTIDMVQQLGINPARIVIEITEAGEDLELLKFLVKKYQRSGMRVAVNDLKLANEHVQVLSELKPDYFILNISEINNHVRLGVRNQVSLALDLARTEAGTRILCEGVETEEDYFCALGFGAAQVKGWLFAKEAIVFPEKTAFLTDVLSLNEEFAEQRRLKMQRHIATRNLWVKWLKLIALSRANQKLDEINFKALVKLGIVRCYVCNLEGKQIGGSINFKPNGYIVDASSRNVSRKARPYFAMALQLCAMKKGKTLISNIYSDQVTRQACITLSMMVGNQKILFMDVSVDEQSGDFYSVHRPGATLTLA